ncbi:MAG: hypothetical protein UT91_C0011G0042 [Parcubacteria group bacterium GW2011_GWA2_40_23]|nr:MAG: hypothetical protein UT91_C0011G0042 [Parcubacteria group bacterium GW2011_GWA2_40_23]
MLPTQDPLPPPIGLFFHPCEEEGLSKLVAHLPTGKGAVVVLTAQRSVADMNQPGWYLVKIGFPPDTKIALADPVLTQDILEASQDLLANMLDFGFELRTDDRPSIPNDIAILFFDDVGAEPLKAQLTLPTGTVDVIASSDFDEFMDEPGWYMCRLEFMSPDTAYASPIMTEENVTAARQLLDGYHQMEPLRRRLRRNVRLSLVPTAAVAQ